MKRTLTAFTLACALGIALLPVALQTCGCGSTAPACRPCSTCAADETCASTSGGRCCIPAGGNSAPSYDAGHPIDLGGLTGDEALKAEMEAEDDRATVRRYGKTVRTSIVLDPSGARDKLRSDSGS